MTIEWWLWLVPLWLVALVWASRHLDVSRAKREFPPLDEDSYDAPPEPAPKVSVLIAAKDEAIHRAKGQERARLIIEKNRLERLMANS